MPPHSPNGDTDPPFIDEYEVPVSAPALSVWRSLVKLMGHSSGVRNGVVARVLATEPRQASGTPLEEGSSLPGFAVTASVPGKLVELTGSHRFSRYRLVLAMAEKDGKDGATVLSARTYALFPGLHGAVYRLLIIGSGAHRLVVRRLLHGVRDRAEQRRDG